MHEVEPKKKMQFNCEKIKALRLQYEKETSETARKYNGLLRDVESQIDAVNSMDHAAPYIQTFCDSLDTLEKLYQEIAKVHDETLGIDFRVGKYLAQCAARKIGHGQVVTYFEQLQRECTDAIRAVSKSRSIEEDVKPLKIFCQCLTDLRYICKNADRLIADSGVAKNDRNAKLAPLRESKNRLTRQYSEATKLDNLPCGSQAKALCKDILDQYNRQKESILSSDTIGADTNYWFLVGYYKVPIEKAELDFAVDVLGLPADAVKKEPIFFHYTAQHDCILIKAPSAFLDSEAYNDFIRNLYFSFASHLPARNLLFGGVECNSFDAVVSALGEKIHQLDPAYLCHAVAEQSNDLIASNGTLAAVRGHANENSKKQKGESVRDIFNYNQIFADNPQKFLLFCISNYPEGFNAVSASVMQDVRRLLNGGSKGIISVICETTDGHYTESAPMLTAEELHADCFEFSADGQLLFNGHPATADIAAPGFQPRDYWFSLDKYFKASASISLEKLLQAARNVYNKPAPFAIPMGLSAGNSEGQVFHLELSECSINLNGLIIGAVGSGKSAFLHTLILSAASTYSPEDLQFYLADFKSSSDSAEFSHYRKEDGVENLYIPHVRYLLLKGKRERAYDLLDQIMAICNQRAKILAESHCSEVKVYNQLPEVVSGKKPKLPHVIFLIDEYNSMLNGDGSQNADSQTISSSLVEKLKLPMSKARAYGIGIILAGQSVDRSLKTPQIMGNVGCRIALPVKFESELTALFGIDSYETQKQMKKLAGQGDALVTLGMRSDVRHVRTAYSGLSNGSQQLRIAKAIREKYRHLDLSQIEAGSETAVPITEAHKSEIGYILEKDELALEMGISSTNAMRVSMIYSLNSSARNYYACASNQKLNWIERNAIFAFLQQTSGKNREAGFAPVTYLGLEDKPSECLDAYFHAFPWLRNQVQVVDNKTDIAKKLMSLYRLYLARNEAVDSGGSRERKRASDFAPVFVVMRELDWLDDKNAFWLPREEQLAKAAASAMDMNAETAAAFKQLKAEHEAGKITYTEFRERFSEISKKNAAAKTVPQEAGRFTAADVKAALTALYTSGNRYGIFLLVSSESYAAISNGLTRNDQYKKDASQMDYSIFGSFEEFALRKVEKGSPEDCIFIARSGSTVRLYDYSPDICRSWWQSLQKRWSN